ncbi:MAG TPA: RNA 2',3'-cyclic phosphodiesterase [Steroidobacteraceae bacterium]|nr:RNA 2',3'-cyclic phosphodiesterase [Steroidobacteraceae bacterium]
MRMPRLFFALQPKPAEQAAISAALLPVVHAFGARPMPQADLHLTLAFLGEVPADAIPGLQRAAVNVATALLSLQLSRIDYWAAPGVLCLLPEEATTAKPVQLAQALAVAAISCGVRMDEKPFRAHVTVARKVPPAASGKGPWPRPLREPLPFTADGFVLMESARQREGPRYKVIHSWPSGSTDP